MQVKARGHGGRSVVCNGAQKRGSPFANKWSSRPEARGGHDQRDGRRSRNTVRRSLWEQRAAGVELGLDGRWRLVLGRIKELPYRTGLKTCWGRPKTHQMLGRTVRQKQTTETRVVLGAEARRRADLGAHLSPSWFAGRAWRLPPSLYRDIWSLRASLETIRLLGPEQPQIGSPYAAMPTGVLIPRRRGGARSGLDSCLSQDLDDEPEGEGEGRDVGGRNQRGRRAGDSEAGSGEGRGQGTVSSSRWTAATPPSKHRPGPPKKCVSLGLLELREGSRRPSGGCSSPALGGKAPCARASRPGCFRRSWRTRWPTPQRRRRNQRRDLELAASLSPYKNHISFWNPFILRKLPNRSWCLRWRSQSRSPPVPTNPVSAAATTASTRRRTPFSASSSATTRGSTSRTLRCVPGTDPEFTSGSSGRGTSNTATRGQAPGGRYSPSLERQRFTPLRRGDSAGLPPGHQVPQHAVAHRERRRRRSRRGRGLRGSGRRERGEKRWRGRHRKHDLRGHRRDKELRGRRLPGLYRKHN